MNKVSHMEEPNVLGRRIVFSDNNVLEAVGDPLGEIRRQDGLTWTDVGKVLGVGDDSASAYASGYTAMNICAFARGKREWGGRFTGPFDRLVFNSRPGTVCGHTAMNHMLTATAAIHMSFRDGTMSKRELQQNRSTLEVARDQLDELLRLAGEA